MSLRYFSLLSLAACAIALQGCGATGIAAGAGAVIGISAAKEGGIKQSGKDFWISTQISDLWFRYDVETFSKLDVTVKNGRVLLTGVVQNPEARVEAVRLAWQPEDVKQVINEIRVADSNGVSGFFSDKWISAQIRTKITLDKEIQSINYTIDTVQGTVYLIGAAHSQAEINRVIDVARDISNVEQVISYVRLLEEKPVSQIATSNPPQDGNTNYNNIAPASGGNNGEATGAPAQLTPITSEPL